MNAEIDHHLDAGEGDGNRRNGYGRKTVLTGTGKIAGDIPRDRLSRFDPQLIAKYQRRFTGFDGGYTAITDFLRTARPPATPPFEVCFETPPGN